MKTLMSFVLAGAAAAIMHALVALAPSVLAPLFVVYLGAALVATMVYDYHRRVAMRL
jgi:hypothetical protein